MRPYMPVTPDTPVTPVTPDTPDTPVTPVTPDQYRQLSVSAPAGEFLRMRSMMRGMNIW
jgi:hypothetical protein